MKMKELVFRWGSKEYGSRLFRANEKDKETFIECYLYRYLDETGRKEILRQGEEKYSSFEEFWKDFTNVEFWLPNTPVFIHNEYRAYLKEYFSTLDRSSFSEADEIFYDDWMDLINED